MSRGPRRYAFSAPIGRFYNQASFSHLAIKLFLAAPDSGLPSLLTALPSQPSCLHFFKKLLFAAPESGFPSLLTALLSQDCAIAEPTANTLSNATIMIRFIASSHDDCSGL